MSTLRNCRVNNKYQVVLNNNSNKRKHLMVFEVKRAIIKPFQIKKKMFMFN